MQSRLTFIQTIQGIVYGAELTCVCLCICMVHPSPIRSAGHIPLMLGPKSYWKAAEWTNEYGSIYKLQFLDNWSVVVTDPDAIATITRRAGEVTCCATVSDKAV